MNTAEIEEVILALRAAGVSCPQYEILQDGSYHFFTNNGQEIQNPTVYIPESGSNIS